MASNAGNASQWWKQSVVYQIYPRSFADSNGDGVGDLGGIRSHLDHLDWLGINTLWLSPIYPSPMADFGYDVSDYCGIDPVFGDLEMFDGLVEDVHRRGMRLLLDWVPNHTSDRHEWFLDARSSRDSAHRDFYVWRDPAPDGGVPNNWAAALTEAPAWTFDEATEQYYLHLYLAAQPDLNWANPEVEAAMHDTLRFWLDRGVDGFRADAVNLIGKSAELPDDPPELVGLPHCVLHDEAPTHPLLRRIRTLLDSYPQQPMMIGEVGLFDPDLVVKYLGDELHLSFNFSPLHLPWDAELWGEAILATERSHGRHDDWPTWVLSNHDMPRHRTRYEQGFNAVVDARGSEERARAAAVLLLTLRGTPFVYQGEELGLLDAIVPEAEQVDPDGRDVSRAPIPWDASPGWGWSHPWLPLPPECATRNVDAQRGDSTSIAHLYKRLLELRDTTPALTHGAFSRIETPTGVVGYTRTIEGSAPVTVLVNMSDQAVDVAGVQGQVLVDSLSGGPVGGQFSGTLDTRQALILSDP